ncbi:MAG: hypothetical protein CL784_00995 [Chloroflexi bacterium]|nr:hypothetical protein [Chloroflexota bacterium]
MTRSRITTQVILLLVAVTMLAACSKDEESGTKGNFVLNLYVETFDTNETSIDFDELVANDNRPILLNFWAGACPPCRAEMPALEKAWKEHGDEVLFIGVDVGPYVGLGSYIQGRAIIDEFGITYITGNTFNRSVITDWQLSSMPSTFFLKDDGKVYDIVVGAISSSRLNQKVLELIEANDG